MVAAQNGEERVPGDMISIVLYGLVAGLLLLQPDLGMTFVVTVTWFAQFFLAGLPLLWVIALGIVGVAGRSEEHTSELQSLMRISYAVFCLKKKITKHTYETRANVDETSR